MHKITPSENILLSIFKRAWEDTWQWLLNTKIGFIIAFIGGGIMGGVFVGDSLLMRALAGLVGALIGMIILVGIVYIIHIVITPSRLKKEAKHQFIRKNASYITRIFGNQEKKKYSKVLDILQSMIKIENDVTDNMIGKHKATNNQIEAMRKQFNKQTNIPLIPLKKAIKIIASGEYMKKVNQTINKLELGIKGDKPTDNQIEFLIKTRAILDEFGFGLSNGLEKSNEYNELLKTFGEKVPSIDDKTPDWILLFLTFPSGINSAYLYWDCQSVQQQKLFYPTTPKEILEFKSQRELVINQLIEYSNDSIEKM
jgi:hypothetical protein